MQRVLILAALALIGFASCRNRVSDNILSTEANAATVPKMSEHRLATICTGSFEGNKAQIMLFVPDDMAMTGLKIDTVTKGTGIATLLFDGAVEGKGFGDMAVVAKRSDSQVDYEFSGQSNGVSLVLKVALGANRGNNYVGSYQAKAGKDNVSLPLTCSK